eukprot:CAMPEP_0114527832 /NCGR_PEP_ID=MMETSP0109-20121206/23848_1 /TAXON_ID=29199 /ORGANISM="Chlorarachnion reptans, Strain CCCM449" /LENGTH=538 /DNA_ID=CAMNT_0001709867 /DNA_START=483 /DNA_END=2099 /DNA_ORIENTATION=-
MEPEADIVASEDPDENKKTLEELVNSPAVANALESVVNAIRENPVNAVAAAGATGIALTSVATLTDIISQIPAPVMAIEEALGVAVCAYYIPQYALSVQRRRDLKATLTGIWTKATGRSSPFLKEGVDADELEDAEVERLAESEVVGAIDDVLTSYNTTIPKPVKGALVTAIQEIRLEDIRYRQDYKILAEEFELLAIERQELSENIFTMEKKLEALDEECVNAIKRAERLQATLTSVEKDARINLERAKKSLEEANTAAEQARKEKERVEALLENSSNESGTKLLEAQVKALKERLEQALDDQESAQQKAIDVESQYKDSQKSFETELETLKSQLELARLVEATREQESIEIVSQLEMLSDEEARAAAAAATIDSNVLKELEQAADVDETTSEPEATQEISPGKKSKKTANKATGASPKKTPAKKKRVTATASTATSKTDGNKALSRMTKPELQAECKERGISAEGKVAELRVRLRTARKSLTCNEASLRLPDSDLRDPDTYDPASHPSSLRLETGLIEPPPFPRSGPCPEDMSLSL